MLLVGLCCVALTLSPVTAQTPYQDCGKHHLSSAADSSVYLSPTTTGSRGLSIASVNVVNCTQRLCQLKRGDNVTAEITFTASKYPPAPACIPLYCNTTATLLYAFYDEKMVLLSHNRARLQGFDHGSGWVPGTTACALWSARPQCVWPWCCLPNTGRQNCHRNVDFIRVKNVPIGEKSRQLICIISTSADYWCHIKLMLLTVYVCTSGKYHINDAISWWPEQTTGMCGGSVWTALISQY